MDEPFDTKEEQFDRLWRGETPKGINRSKSLRFRQYILQHIALKQRPPTRENALKYWMGDLQREIRDSERF